MPMPSTHDAEALLEHSRWIRVLARRLVSEARLGERRGRPRAGYLARGGAPIPEPAGQGGAALIGRTDERGFLMLALQQAPESIEFVRKGWSVTRRTGFDEAGELDLVGRSGGLSA